jgi:hypothetical protein
MGGMGSGRHWHWSAKATTDSMLKLDVRRLARDGLLKPGSLFGWYWRRDDKPVGNIRIEVHENSLTLSYRANEGGEEWERLSYPVRLLTQPCNLGGERRWFACPALGCGRRVALLYGGRIFACRSCHGLVYPSQREQRFQRYQRRVDSIKSRLGWDAEGWGDWGPKPKGMHYTTFARLTSEIDRLEYASNNAFVEYFSERFGSPIA